jgi:uncharacterized membrane protein YhaH (DUF805 family)
MIGLEGRCSVAKVMASLRHCTANLARFSGRDTPGQFWPWAILVFLAGTIASFIVMVPPILRGMIRMFETIEAARRTGAPQPTEQQLQEMIITQFSADFAALWQLSAAINLISALLLGAAIVRRLHDRDYSGLWGLAPLPFMAISIVSMQAGLAVATGRADLTRLEVAASSASSVYMLVIIGLIVLLVGDGARGANRFGPDPRGTP